MGEVRSGMVRSGNEYMKMRNFLCYVAVRMESVLP